MALTGPDQNNSSSPTELRNVPPPPPAAPPPPPPPPQKKEMKANKEVNLEQRELFRAQVAAFVKYYMEKKELEVNLKEVSKELEANLKEVEENLKEKTLRGTLQATYLELFRAQIADLKTQIERGGKEAEKNYNQLSIKILKGINGIQKSYLDPLEREIESNKKKKEQCDGDLKLLKCESKDRKMESEQHLISLEKEKKDLEEKKNARESQEKPIGTLTQRIENQDLYINEEKEIKVKFEKEQEEMISFQKKKKIKLKEELKALDKKLTFFKKLKGQLAIISKEEAPPRKKKKETMVATNLEKISLPKLNFSEWIKNAIFTGSNIINLRHFSKKETHAEIAAWCNMITNPDRPHGFPTFSLEIVLAMAAGYIKSSRDKYNEVMPLKNAFVDETEKSSLGDLLQSFAQIAEFKNQAEEIYGEMDLGGKDLETDYSSFLDNFLYWLEMELDKNGVKVFIREKPILKKKIPENKPLIFSNDKEKTLPPEILKVANDITIKIFENLMVRDAAAIEYIANNPTIATMIISAGTEALQAFVAASHEDRKAVLEEFTTHLLMDDLLHSVTDPSIKMILNNNPQLARIIVKSKIVDGFLNLSLKDQGILLKQLAKKYNISLNNATNNKPKV